MPKHIKPTQEELDKGIQDSLAALEAETTEPKETSEPTPTETVEEPKEEIKPDPKPVTEEVQEKAEEKPLDTEDVDYKKKFSESSREAQKIAAKSRVVNQSILEAGDIPVPTEEEMAKQFPDWESMDDFSKKLATDNTWNSKRLEKIAEGAKEGDKIDKWNQTVEKYIEDPAVLTKIPDLDGRQEEFKLFATNPQYNSVPFDLLVPAFLHQAKATKTTNKGAMLETGSGGPNDKPQPKSDILTVEDGAKLRESDYKKYTELLKAGKIADL